MGGDTHRPSELFGPYEVFETLGAGGMARVHRAKKIGIAGFTREVALKRLLSHLAVDRSFVEAFVREAKLAVRLRHPSIAHIYELGKVGDTYFISMEYVEGHDLRDVLRELARERQRMPIDVAIAILLELCDALDYAHTRTDDLTGEPLGIVHRDISPSNLVVTEGGHLKVIDFGIAKATPRELATQSGRLKGKFGYMSPEALRTQATDARSDLFSVGVVAHEMLTTRRLFGGNHTYDTLRRIHREEIPPPSAINPEVPAALDSAVLIALERDPDDRFQSAEEMRAALYRVALERSLAVTSDQVAAYLDDLMGEPVEIILEAAPADDEDDDWMFETDVESVPEIDPVEEPTLIEEAVVGAPPAPRPPAMVDLSHITPLERSALDALLEDEPSRP